MHLCFSCISYWSLVVGYIGFAGRGHQKIIEAVMRGGGGGGGGGGKYGLYRSCLV